MKRFYIINIVLILFAFATGVSAQSSSDIRNYIAKYSQIALEQERTYGVPASICHCVLGIGHAKYHASAEVSIDELLNRHSVFSPFLDSNTPAFPDLSFERAFY